MPAIRYRTAFSFHTLHPLQVCPGDSRSERAYEILLVPVSNKKLNLEVLEVYSETLNWIDSWLAMYIYTYHFKCEPVHFHVPNARSINVIANKVSSWILKKADTQTLFILPWYWKWNSSDNMLFLSLWMYMGKTQIHVFYSLSSMKTILYFKC